jgi:uncharacterized RDD family membrane protein YckC
MDPTLTHVLRRRALAAVLDLLVVAAVLAAAAALLVERFAPDATGAFTPDDAARLNELADQPNRAQEWSDTLLVLGGERLLGTLAVGVAGFLVVYVLLPGLTGRTPGKRLFALRLVRVDGARPGLGRSALRTVVGVVDVLPVVPPWLVGLVLARRSPTRQRLGDRVAHTLVVDDRREPDVRRVDDDLVEHLETAAAAPASGGGRARSEAVPLPSIRGPEVAVDEPAPGIAVGSPSAAVDPTRPEALDEPPAEQRTPVAPGHRAADRTPQDWERPRAEPAPVWDPTAPVEPALLELTPAHAPDPNPEPVRSRRPDRIPPMHRRPRPAPTHRTGPAGPAAPAGTVAPDPGATVPPRAGAAPAAAGSPAPSPAASAPRPAASAPQPVWNADWQAWLYYDQATSRWHRHDPEAGRWVAIS